MTSSPMDVIPVSLGKSTDEKFNFRDQLYGEESKRLIDRSPCSVAIVNDQCQILLFSSLIKPTE